MRTKDAYMRFVITGTIWYWKGPAPFYFVTVPKEQSHELKALAGMVTYGWGMIPVTATLGQTTWKTSLFPKDGQYIVPVKSAVRQAESVQDNDVVTLELEVSALGDLF